MARITKVEGSIRVMTESGGAFTISVTGHGMRSSGSIHDLGPYVGRLVSEELRKVLVDEPQRELPIASTPPPPQPKTPPSPPQSRPKRPQGGARG